MTRNVVVKIGGSLLAAPHLCARVRRWLAEESAARPEAHFVFVVGGGKLVDAVRELDSHVSLDEKAAHWLCIELMGVTAGLVAAMLPELPVVEDFDQLELRTRAPGATLLRPLRFLREIEPTRRGTPLPANWSVTSDSIAARLAVVLEAEELVLLKSASPPIPAGDRNWLERLAACGYVDPFLPRLTGELPHRSVRMATLPDVRKSCGSN